VGLAACNNESELRVLEPNGGSIAVFSEPAGATIWLEGEQTEHTTPDTIHDMPLGSHVVGVERAGYYPESETVLLSQDLPIASVHFTLSAQCPGDNVVGDAGLDPEIGIVGLTAGSGRVSGTVNNVDLGGARVVLWAKTDLWYVQPYINQPFTLICGDASWSNTTHAWARMAALLVDGTYVPGSPRDYHPSLDAGVLAWDEYPERDQDRTLSFSGYRWIVKSAESHRAGPGPNFFSDRADDVWVDGDGLHLTTASHDGQWYSTEVFLDDHLGFGTYTFKLSSRVDSLDYYSVFSGFVYESSTREFDIESSQVLAQPEGNAQYVIQPYYHAGNIERFAMSSADRSTHRFVWGEGSIGFVSWRGHADEPQPDAIIHQWTYTGADVPPAAEERMRFNLWLFDGRVPASGERDEVVVTSFSFVR
jgi:hypothetical protein